MDRDSSRTESGQGASEVSAVFLEEVRGAIRGALERMMGEEVERLCGAFYRPRKGGVYRRAGSERGRYFSEGHRETVVRPRVRVRDGLGREREVGLVSYAAAKSRAPMAADIIGMLNGGMGRRSVGRLGKKGLSASTAGRLWRESSARAVDALRQRDLRTERFVALMVDGVVLSREQTAVVALGVTADGRKMILDFEVGATENLAVCRALMGRLTRRGFVPCARKLLAVLDGAEALDKAVAEAFPGVVVQRCWVHKERNLHGYLRKGDHAECRRLVGLVLKAQGRVAGREAYANLRRFLGERSHAAVASLDEGGAALLAFHDLDVTATLNTSFLSTNLIENALLNYRRQTSRVTRWQPQTDQADRWTATALLWVEQGFRRIRNHEHLPALVRALGGETPPPPAPVSAPGEANPSGSSTPSTTPGAEALPRP